MSSYGGYESLLDAAPWRNLRQWNDPPVRVGGVVHATYTDLSIDIVKHVEVLLRVLLFQDGEFVGKESTVADATVRLQQTLDRYPSIRELSVQVDTERRAMLQRGAPKRPRTLIPYRREIIAAGCYPTNT